MNENLHLILHHLLQLCKPAHTHQFAINATGVGNKAVHEVLRDLVLNHFFCLHCLCPNPHVVWTDEGMQVVWTGEGMQVVWTGEGMVAVWTDEGMQVVWTGEEM